MSHARSSRHALVLTAATLLLVGLASCGDDAHDPAGDRPAADADAPGAPGPDAGQPHAPFDSAVERLRARVPDSALVRGGACPFECCMYGRWVSRAAIPLRPMPRWSSTVTATVPPDQPFRADSGFVRVEDIFLVIVHDTVTGGPVRFEAGDTLVVLDYMGEGSFNVWHEGEVVPVWEGFWGAESERLVAETRGRYRREWWVHASAPGAVKGWFLADSVADLDGVDACSVPDYDRLGWRPGEVRPTWPNAFDPSDLDVGDLFLGLEVVEKDVHRVGPDSIWSGRVRFRGPIRLEGVYQPHFDAPEVGAACMDVAPDSRQRLPAFLPDDVWATGRRSWFCFRDAERARRLLGPPEPARHVTVTVDGYEALRIFTDAWDTAELMEVLEVGEEAQRTLRMTLEEAWGRERQP